MAPRSTRISTSPTRSSASSPPIVLGHGDWIDYECLHDNGVSRPVRRDPFGNPTRLVFGTTSEDEMCTLNGEFYTQ